MLNVCGRLSTRFKLDKLIFQIGFLLWFFASGGTALLVYFILSLLLDDK